MTEDRLRRRDFTLSPYTMRGAEACEAARVYVPVARDKPSHAMWWGIAIHRFIEYAQKHDREYALRYIAKKFPRSLKTCEKLDLDILPPGDVEVQFVIDIQAGTGGVVIGGDEEDPTRHIKARCDLFSTALGVHVIDFKTGDRKVDPQTSIQMAAVAIGAWLDGQRQADSVRATTLNIVDGEFIPNDYIFERPALEAALERLRRVHLLTLEARAEMGHGNEPDFTPGDHCGWCHARSGCSKSMSNT